MSTLATLEPTVITIEPGSEAAVPLIVSNDSDIVEDYRFEVSGLAGEWARIEPPHVPVYPGQSATVTVTFAPPRSPAVRAGQVNYAIKVLPLEHPEDVMVPEGVLEILPFRDTTAELLPRASGGPFGARHRIAVDNRGNVPISVQLSGTDQGELLNFNFRNDEFIVEPGTVQFADVKLRPSKIIYRGAAVTHPFTISVAQPDAAPIRLDGTHLQGAVLPSWLIKALLALLALILALVALWFLVVRPAVESAATEAAEEVVEPVAKEAASNAAEAGVAAKSAEEASLKAQDAAEKLGDPVVTEVETPVAERLEVTASPGTTEDTPFLFESDEATFRLTDLVMSNPQGDFGRMRLELETTVLFDLALENFRDTDYHFLTPIQVESGDDLRLTLTCHRAGAPPDQNPAPTNCNASAFIGGKMAIPVEPAEVAASTPTPTPTPAP